MPKPLRLDAVSNGRRGGRIHEFEIEVAARPGLVRGKDGHRHAGQLQERGHQEVRKCVLAEGAREAALQIHEGSQERRQTIGEVAGGRECGDQCRCSYGDGDKDILPLR